MNYIEFKADLKKFKNLPSPLIVSDLYKHLFLDYADKIQMYLDDLNSYIATFNIELKYVDAYTEVVKAITNVINNKSVRQVVRLYDEDYNDKDELERTYIIEDYMPVSTRQTILEDEASKLAPQWLEHYLARITKHLQSRAYPNGPEACPDISICGNIGLEAKASKSEYRKGGDLKFNNNNGTYNVNTLAVLCKTQDGALFNEIVVNMFYLPVYNEELNAVENHWWGAVVNFMPCMLDISYIPELNYYYFIKRSDGDNCTNNGGKLKHTRYKDYMQYTKTEILVNLINQENGYDVMPLVNYREYKCMNIINDGFIYNSENKKVLLDYKNYLKDKKNINDHDKELLNNLQNILNNITVYKELEAYNKKIEDMKINSALVEFLNKFNKICSKIVPDTLGNTNEDLNVLISIIKDNFNSLNTLLSLYFSDICQCIALYSTEIDKSILCMTASKQKGYISRYKSLSEQINLFNKINQLHVLDNKKYDNSVYNVSNITNKLNQSYTLLMNTPCVEKRKKKVA